jgi:phenylacetate-CoA ligase
VKNLYSCTEAGYLASPCPAGHGLHVHSENVILEILDDDNRPCRSGESGRVVLTPLHNFLTPFLRYDIMDRATLGPEKCPCGRGLPLLAAVEGKLRPLVRLTDGRHKSSAFLIDLLMLGEVAHQYQIIQKKVDHVVIRLVPSRKWNDDAARRLERQLREYLEAPVRVDIECLDRVQMTAGGKVRGVVVEIDSGIEKH